MSIINFPAKRTFDDYHHSMSSEINGGYDDSRHKKCSKFNSSCLINGELRELNPRLHLQFFVKMMSDSKTLVFQANFGDTVENLHWRIQMITGIPVSEQRLIYKGKQLQFEQTMAECGIENDAGLQLVGRIRSTGHAKAWRVISELVKLISLVCSKESPFLNCEIVKVKLDEFLQMPLDRDGNFSEYCDKSEYYKIFMDAYVPKALVLMYRSGEKKTQECAEECIKRVISLGDRGSGGSRSEITYCAMIILEFCRLLKTSSLCHDDVLYLHYRSTLGMKLERVQVACRSERDDDVVNNKIPFIAFRDVFPILEEVGHRLLKDLMQSVESSTSCGPRLLDVCDFSAFLKPVLSVIRKELAAAAAASLEGKGKGKICLLGDEVNRLVCLFIDLLNCIGKCMGKIEDCLSTKGKKGAEVFPTSWSHYLSVLKDLRSIAVIYPGFEYRFWNTVRKNKLVVSALVVLYASHADDHSWLRGHKDVLDFESRRHLALLMFSKVDEDYDELHEMLIDRSQLLAESFEYIYNADKSSLQAGLFMEFKNEQATGPGVLREWFCLVCQAFFDPQRALFVACPLDRRRFYPNPASEVNPLHIQYFNFAGRVIALALMHKIQIGGVLDRVFFLQLAGRRVFMEDIKDADPCVYNSCKQILEMDPDFVDSDALGLTFVTEVEELGSMKVVELCPGGKGIAVNSKNRKEYVQLLVEQRFVTSITKQVSSFAKGFADILRNANLGTTFFESLELEDLDWMLHGRGSQEISVDDWKAHTEYDGYKKSDPQIIWFWKVVRQLSAEQKKTLLFFWTSVKYLPVEGFRGLSSKLFIYKSMEPQDRLPSSHTCFYQLCIPQYSTKAIMKDRLRVITQEHVGCSFGTW